MAIKVVKEKISREELLNLAHKEFGDGVKAVVDVEQGIMAVGGELHADEETELTEKHGSKREFVWGINIYPKKTGEDWIEFDSMINIKPLQNNSSRGVEDLEIQKSILGVVKKLTGDVS